MLSRINRSDSNCIIDLYQILPEEFSSVPKFLVYQRAHNCHCYMPWRMVVIEVCRLFPWIWPVWFISDKNLPGITSFWACQSRKLSQQHYGIDLAKSVADFISRCLSGDLDRLQQKSISTHTFILSTFIGLYITVTFRYPQKCSDSYKPLQLSIITEFLLSTPHHFSIAWVTTNKLYQKINAIHRCHGSPYFVDHDSIW